MEQHGFCCGQQEAIGPKAHSIKIRLIANQDQRRISINLSSTKSILDKYGQSVNNLADRMLTTSRLHCDPTEIFYICLPNWSNDLYPSKVQNVDTQMNRHGI